MESKAERRKEPRTPHRAVVIMPYGEGEKLAFEKAMLVDCSPGGVGIELNRPLRTGEPFLLKVKRERVMLVVYNVRYCRSLATGQHEIGAEFAGVIVSPGEPPVGRDVVYEALLQTGTA
jgi:PilZ domain